MKKFLIYLTAIVVFVSLGMTTYYFLRNDEVISVGTNEIYCNAGDVISLDELNIKVKKKNKTTTYDYNAGGEDVTYAVEYNDDLKSYVVASTAGGDVDLVISTSNRKYSRLKVTLHIGNGTTAHPYYIFSSEDLSRIGTKYPANKAFILKNDIDLADNFAPIENFNGVFDGNYHTIRGQKIADQKLTNAGLFATIKANATVKNLTIENSRLSGEFENVGVLAGTIYGTVENVAVKNSTITNACAGANTGSVAGKCADTDIFATSADNVTVNVTSIDKLNMVGGFIGRVSKSSIKACYAKGVVVNVEAYSNFTAGFVGYFEIGTILGSIQQSYAQYTSNRQIFAFVGTVDSASVSTVSGYMLRHFVGNVVVSEDCDEDIINTMIGNYDTRYFKNTADETQSPFYDVKNAIYGVVPFNGVDDITDNNFILYAINDKEVTHWDSGTIWDMSTTLPTLVKTPLTPTSPSGEYLRKLSSTQKEVEDDDDIKEIIEDKKDDTDDEKKEDIEIKFINPDITIDPSTWSTRAIKDMTIDGKISDTQNATLTLTVNTVENNCLGLFSTVDNCTIKNLNIIIKGFKGEATYAGALAGRIFSSTSNSNCELSNIVITFEGCNFIDCGATYFGGVAGTISNCNINNVQVNGLDSRNGTFTTSAGFAVEAKSCNMNKVSVDAVMSGANVAGLVYNNYATIKNANVSATIYANENKETRIGGAVVSNNGSILDSNIMQNVYVEKTSTAYIAGVAYVNYGTISNCTVSGEGVSIQKNYSPIYIGGLVTLNSGKIEDSIVKVSNIGAIYANSNVYVGGLTYSNNGKITKCVMSSALKGSCVAGLSYEMSGSTSATIDQAYIGSIDLISHELGSIELQANKYLAGFVVDFRYGTITNVQSKANLNGLSNTSRTSLVVLVFDVGASVRNSTVDSGLYGNGTFYREVWTDFAECEDNVNFALTETEKSLLAKDTRFNLYTANTNHGVMQSVVINSANTGFNSAKYSLGSATAWITDYDSKDTNSSFVKTTNRFTDANEFQGSFEFLTCVSSLLKIQHKATKTLTFDIGNIWTTGNGISLQFLSELNA